MFILKWMLMPLCSILNFSTVFYLIEIFKRKKAEKELFKLISVQKVVQSEISFVIMITKIIGFYFLEF